MKENNIKKLRKFIAIIILGVLLVAIIKLLPTFASLVTEDGRIAFEQKIESLGIKGVFAIIALQICKIILVFLPGEPIELLAGMCYGPVIGMIAIYIGVIISNILIIVAVKKYGVKFVRDVIPDEKIVKISKMITDNPGRIEITLFVLYFLPALPKDFITYVASLLPIAKKTVLGVSIIGRLPAVFSSVLVGSRIIAGDLKSIILIYLITYIISGIIAMIYNKRKERSND